MADPSNHVTGCTKHYQDIKESFGAGFSVLTESKKDIPDITTNKLLDLPSEIRYMIYDYTVGTPAEPFFLNTVTIPPLAHTCRDIRKETLPTFFTINTFHVIADSPTSVNDNKNKNKKADPLTFKIHPGILNLLTDLGSRAPIFKSLNIDFGHDCRNGLAIRCGRAGMTITHQNDCCFCYPPPEIPSPPAKVLAEARVDMNLFNNVVRLNSARLNEVGSEHDGALEELRETLVGDGLVDERATSLSLMDLMVLEKGINSGIATCSLAVQGVSQSRLKHTPLFVRIDGKLHDLRKGA